MARKASSNPADSIASTVAIGLGSFSIRNSSFGISSARRLAIRGIEADFGPEHADTFRRDLYVECHVSAACNYGRN